MEILQAIMQGETNFFFKDEVFFSWSAIVFTFNSMWPSRAFNRRSEHSTGGGAIAVLF